MKSIEEKKKNVKKYKTRNKLQETGIKGLQEESKSKEERKK